MVMVLQIMLAKSGLEKMPFPISYYPNWHQLLLLSPFGLPLVMALTFYALVVFRISRQSGGETSRYGRDYAMMAVTCLLVFAMVPAYGFFKFAWNGEMNLYALFTQFDFTKDLDQREQALRRFYQGVTFRPETAREQFIRARVSPYDRDVYTEFLLHPRLDVQPGLSERVLALVRIPVNDRLSTEIGGLLNGEGYNRAWVSPKQAIGSTQMTAWLDRLVSSLGLARSTQDASLNLPPGIPHWLYWTLSLGALLVLYVRHAVTQTMGRRERLIPMAMLVFLLFLVLGFAIWPGHPVFIGIAIVGLFIRILYALPQIIVEGLRVLDCQLRPTIDGFVAAEAQQKRREELSLRRPVSPLSYILWPVKIGLLALVGFIIFTQEEYRPIALAALATILPEISKLLPELHKILGGLKPPKANST